MNLARISLLILLTPMAAIAEPINFVRDVRPIFERHCYACHGPDKQKSGLRLDMKVAAFKGGDAYGPAIVARSPETSPLLRLVRGDEADLRMPPKEPVLSENEIATLRRWIDEGAAWPDGIDRVKPTDPSRHWSFQPVIRPAAPQAPERGWPRNDIDRFILARLEESGLHPSPEAAPVEWLRRVCFDLTGLPPSPELAQRFLSNPSEQAYQRVVDELLDSPRYGEHWAQHWLDVVRYADTHGFEVNTERPHAWPYRDYVITVINADTPYDQFVREQIVGDSLGKEAATGFLVTASVLLPGQIGKDEPSKRLARYDALDEILVNVSQTFLGLSIGCARCHDHKFDPISQVDYYSLLAVFGGVEYGDRELHTPEADARRSEEKQVSTELEVIVRQLASLVPLAKSGTARPAVNARLNVDRFEPILAKRVRLVVQATNNREPCIDELEVYDTAGMNVALASCGTQVTASTSNTISERHKLSHVHDGRYGNARSWISAEAGQGWIELVFPREVTIDRVLWGRDREGRFNDRLATKYQIDVADSRGEWQTVADSSDRQPFDPKSKTAADVTVTSLVPAEQMEARRLASERTILEARIKSLEAGQKVFAGIFRAPDRIHVLFRGDPEQPKQEAAPAVPTIFGTLTLDPSAAETDRRKALADWLTSREHPLTARVYVNRLWQGHFGLGLVETASDFGQSGTRPSHPELLDWLAAELMDGSWSSKHLHRLIVLSAAYRQASQVDPQAADKDGDVRLLWRYPAARLNAEVIRDSMLAVSGQLNLQMYGAGFDLFDRRGGLTGFTPVEVFEEDGLRRMIYAHKVRRERDAVFGAFDCPDGGQSTSRRRESTTPIQALNLLNSRFTIDRSAAFAGRLQTEAGNDVSAQVCRAYELAFSRQPTAAEQMDACQVVKAHGLATLCRAIFNSNEFLFAP